MDFRAPPPRREVGTETAPETRQRLKQVQESDRTTQPQSIKAGARSSRKRGVPDAQHSLYDGQANGHDEEGKGKE